MVEMRYNTMKLEYEITRASKCADLQRKGFTYRPGTTMAKVCQDIVPISSTLPPKKKKFLQKMSSLTLKWEAEAKAKAAKAAKKKKAAAKKTTTEES